MTDWVRPPHISEREDAHTWPDGQRDDAADEDCVFDSGLRQYLGAVPGGAPATHTEAERLRQSAGLGPSGGASSQDLARGVKARYGYELTIIASGIDSLKQFLKPGMSATVSGKLSNFPSGHRLRRFYPYFTGGHRVFLANYGDYLWWGDPGAPQGTYTGEKVTWSEVATFVKGGSSHTLAPLAEDSEVLTITDQTPKQVTTKDGAVYYDPATGAKVTKAASTQTRISPYATAVGRVVVVHRSASNTDQLLAVKSGDPAVTITAAPPSSATEQQLAAAKSLGFQQGKTKAAAAAAAVTEA